MELKWWKKTSSKALCKSERGSRVAGSTGGDLTMGSSENDPKAGKSCPTCLLCVVPQRIPVARLSTEDEAVLRIDKRTRPNPGLIAVGPYGLL
jgi:hypothetical protein